MKKKHYIIISLVLYFLSFIFAYKFFSYNLNASPIFKIYALLLCCLFIHYGGYFLSKCIGERYKKIIFKINIIIFLILYLVLLIDITIFDNFLHRTTGNIFKIETIWRKKYLAESMNLIPFHSIITYFTSFFSGNISASIFFNNLLGNIILISPLGVLLPLLSKYFKKLFSFLIVITFVSVSIEVLQLITLSGTVDIDDIILNVLGAIISYKLFYTNLIQTFLNRYFYFK